MALALLSQPSQPGAPACSGCVLPVTGHQGQETQEALGGVALWGYSLGHSGPRVLFWRAGMSLWGEHERVSLCPCRFMNQKHEIPEGLVSTLNVKSATATPWWWGLWTIMRVSADRGLVGGGGRGSFSLCVLICLHCKCVP